MELTIEDFKEIMSHFDEIRIIRQDIFDILQTLRELKEK